nr:transglycosylase SLT domain-containing protein [Chloroflexota bacterium]
LTGIARQYGSTIPAIVKANAIRNPSLVRVGQRLTIPGAATAPAAKPPTPAAQAAAPRIHVVARGETLTGIARQYGSTIPAIVKANAIRNPSLVRVGQRLTIPGAAAAPTDRMPSTISSLMAARSEIRAILRAEAKSQGVPVALALAVAWQESGWRPNVVSRAGAIGVMQLTPATADWVATTILGHRIDLRDARSNVQAGVALLRHYLDRYHGDRRLALAAYYQGQTAADRFGVYRITRPYIASILAVEKLLGS